MTKTLQSNNIRQQASLAQPRNDGDGGFKRLALPAVAAAVQTLAGARRRSDWPAVRRRDGKPN